MMNCENLVKIPNVQIITPICKLYQHLSNSTATTNSKSDKETDTD